MAWTSEAPQALTCSLAPRISRLSSRIWHWHQIQANLPLKFALACSFVKIASVSILWISSIPLPCYFPCMLLHRFIPRLVTILLTVMLTNLVLLCLAAWQVGQSDRNGRRAGLESATVAADDPQEAHSINYMSSCSVRSQPDADVVTTDRDKIEKGRGE